jgi:hypothetical protein
MNEQEEREREEIIKRVYVKVTGQPDAADQNEDGVAMLAYKTGLKAGLRLGAQAKSA